MCLAYVIIDSIDECVERKETLKWIKGIVLRGISTLHMAVVSRPEQDIEDVLKPLDARCVDLAEESESDIMLYLEQQLLPLATQWDRETRDFIKLTLAGSADGMYESFCQFKLCGIVTYSSQVPMGCVTAHGVRNMLQPTYREKAGCRFAQRFTRNLRSNFVEDQ
jgi:hypothetical protein